MKRTERNWDEIQQAYNRGLTWSEIRQNYNVCSATLDWAKKNGFLKLRTRTEAQKLAWKSGKMDVEKYKTEDFRKKHSKTGGLKENAGRCKHIDFIKKDGIKVHLQGTWELKLAEFLESKNIIWERNKVGYRYMYEGRERNYFPDFYLKDFNLFVEVKGYETNKDRAKWSQFPFKLSVLKKKEIQDLESWHSKL